MVLVWLDTSHGANHSIDAALRPSGLRNFWIMMMICWSAPHGPDRCSKRRHQLAETAQVQMQRMTPNTFPLLQELAPAMMQGLSQSGVSFCGDDAEGELWAYLSRRPWFTADGERCNLNKFMSTIAMARRNAPTWEVMFFERLFLGLEMDFLKDTGVERLVKLRGIHEDAGREDHGSLSRHVVTVDDEAPRGCVANSIVVSVVLLAEPGKNRIVNLVVELSDPLRRLRIQQDK